MKIPSLGRSFFLYLFSDAYILFIFRFFFGRYNRSRRGDGGLRRRHRRRFFPCCLYILYFRYPKFFIRSVRAHCEQP